MRNKAATEHRNLKMNTLVEFAFAFAHSDRAARADAWIAPATKLSLSRPGTSNCLLGAAIPDMAGWRGADL